MEDGGCVGCLLQSYFNVGWESKLRQVHPVCAKVDGKSLGRTPGLWLVLELGW